MLNIKGILKYLRYIMIIILLPVILAIVGNLMEEFILNEMILVSSFKLI
jgi:hypothetical protein